MIICNWHITLHMYFIGNSSAYDRFYYMIICNWLITLHMYFISNSSAHDGFNYMIICSWHITLHMYFIGNSSAHDGNNSCQIFHGHADRETSPCHAGWSCWNRQDCAASKQIDQAVRRLHGD